MIIKMDAREFNSCISKFGKVVSKTSPIPILNCIRFHAGKDGVMLSAMDADHLVRIKSWSGSTEEAEDIFCDYSDLKKMNGLKEGLLTIETKNGKVEFRNSKKSYAIRKIDIPKDQCPMPAGVCEETKTYIPTGVLSDLKTMRVMAGKNGISDLMSGIHINPKMNSIVTLDGHRIAKRSVSMEDAESFTIPAKSEEILKVLIDGDMKYNLEVKINLPFVEFIGDGFSYTVRTIEGEYFHYEKMIDDANDSMHKEQHIIFDTKELKSIAQGYSKFFGKYDDPIMYIVANNNGVATGFKTYDIESTDILEDARVMNTSENYKVGINPSYIVDALNFCGEEKVIFTARSSSRSPVLLSNDEHEKVCLVLPRMTSEDDVKFVEEKLI